jgi:hypothetical protein
MFKRLFGRRAPNLRMPEVEESLDAEEIFDNARKAAAGEGERPPGGPGQRYVVIVTPGRSLGYQLCPPPGSMPKGQVAQVEGIIPPTPKRNIAVIGYTEFGSATPDIRAINAAIPFFGILAGIAYIGHAVWVFEGHPSALAAGCRDADALLVDGGMIPFLQKGWMSVAAGTMRNVAIYVHDRSNFSLGRVA